MRGSYYQRHSGGFCSFDYDIVVCRAEASKSLDFSVTWVRKYDGVCAMFVCMHLEMIIYWQNAQCESFDELFLYLSNIVSGSY